MPGLVHHTLFVALREGQHEVISRRMVLQPVEGRGVLKALGEVSLREKAIAEIDGVWTAWVDGTAPDLDVPTASMYWFAAVSAYPDIALG